MTNIKIYLDEDVHTYIAEALRLRGWEALTTEEAVRRGRGDPDQIAFATNQGYTILTYNSDDYPRLHYTILGSGETHTGIILATQDNPRHNIRALLNLLNSLSAEEMRDQLVYLNNWVP
jgi:predicted nuclease of predicted toxin-antitoxin system